MNVSMNDVRVVGKDVITAVDWTVWIDGEHLRDCIEADDVLGKVTRVEYEEIPDPSGDVDMTPRGTRHVPRYVVKRIYTQEGKVVLECKDTLGSVIYRTPE